MVRKILICTVATFMLASCNETARTGTSDQSGVVVTTVSGNTMDLTGTWSSCNPSQVGNTSFGVQLNFDQLALQGKVDAYNTSDCTGIGTPLITKIHSILVKPTPATLVGWEDSQGQPVSAPAAALAGGGVLSVSDITILEATLISETATAGTTTTGVIGSTSIGGYVVDDTDAAAKPLIYSLTFDAATGTAIANPYNPLTKQ